MFIENWKELPKQDVYLCFSLPLFRFREVNEVYPLAKEVHRVTGKTFSVFIKGDKLQGLLEEWTKNRPTKK